MARALTADGYAVTTTSSGEEGIKAAIEHVPDAITLDIAMPGMDGWDVLRALKQEPRLAGVPVIMVTGTDQENRGFAFGAAEYLTKPVDWAKLHDVLEQYATAATRHILLVEDDETTRQMMRRSLEKAGWHVDEAANGRIAIERMAQSRPALIILDLMMPEVNGFDPGDRHDGEGPYDSRSRPAGRWYPGHLPEGQLWPRRVPREHPHADQPPAGELRSGSSSLGRRLTPNWTLGEGCPVGPHRPADG
jgi:CheY-like chemotaxis protein